MKRLLIVEDDHRLSDHLSRTVAQEGHASTIVGTIGELDNMLAGSDEFSAIVLDRLLGSFDTKDRLAAIKKRWPQTPVIVLSAINTPIERAEVIDLGADDYLGKPFLTKEFLARLNATARRGGAAHQNYRMIGNTVLDLTKRTLSVGEKSDTLPAKEFLLVKILTDEVGRVLNRAELLEAVWGTSPLAETNVVEATISNLRKRFEALGCSIAIKNMRNAGYWIED